MRTLFLATAVFIAVGTFSATDLWAGGVPAPGDPSCAVPGDKVSNKAVALIGTMAVDANGPSDADYIVRLEARHSAPAFFRRNLLGTLAGLSNAEVVCRILDPNNTTDPAAATAFTDDLRAAYGFSTGVNFYILCTGPSGSRNCSKSVYNDETVTTATQRLIPPGNTRSGSLADITIYAQ